MAGVRRECGGSEAGVGVVAVWREWVWQWVCLT